MSCKHEVMTQPPEIETESADNKQGNQHLEDSTNRYW